MVNFTEFYPKKIREGSNWLGECAGTVCRFEWKAAQMNGLG